MNEDKAQIKALVRGTYDIQKLRIQMGLRIVANLKVRLGQAPSTKESELDADAKRILTELRVAYRRITDGVSRVSPKKFKGEGIIDTFTDFALAEQYVELCGREAAHFKRIEQALESFPIWAQWLKGVSGCGPAMAGVIISEIDITKSRYPSSLFRYAGLDVAGDGRGRSRRAEHLVKVAYKDKEGNDAERNGITFNPFLKTKLTGVLGGSFLKVRESPYKDVYYAYKTRLENHPAHVEKTKGHRHNMAIRYMVKLFLVDLYMQWRTLEGLEVHGTYAEGKLGIMHKGGDHSWLPWKPIQLSEPLIDSNRSSKASHRTEAPKTDQRANS